MGLMSLGIVSCTHKTVGGVRILMNFDALNINTERKTALNKIYLPLAY